jgi:hypothetical protein
VQDYVGDIMHPTMLNNLNSVELTLNVHDVIRYNIFHSFQDSHCWSRSREVAVSPFLSVFSLERLCLRRHVPRLGMRRYLRTLSLVAIV